MSKTHSRDGKRVEEIVVTDEPHERYRAFNPWTGEKLDTGIPILKATPTGNIIDKDIRYFRVLCPECRVESKYDSGGDPICPECGMVCTGNEKELDPIVMRDAKAAGRLNDKDQ